MEKIEVDENASIAAMRESELATILKALLPHLSCRDWPSLRLVCKGWNHAVRYELRNMKSLKVQDFLGATEDAAMKMDFAKWIEYHCDALSVFIEYMIKRHCKSLTNLQFFDSGYGSPIRLSAANVRSLAQPPFCSRLKMIDFTGVQVPWQAFFQRFLPECVNVETLVLRRALKKLILHTELDESIIANSFSRLAKLVHLDMTGASWFTGRALGSISASVQSLILDDCQLNWKVVATSIRKLEKLRVLSFTCGLVPIAAEAIASLPNLEVLLIDGVKKTVPNGNRFIITALKNPASRLGASLHTLCFGATKSLIIPEEMKAYFEQSRTQAQLKVLEIHSRCFTRVNDDAFEPVRECLISIGMLTGLRHLEVSLQDRLANQGASILTAVFQGCKQLEKLAIKLDFMWVTTDENTNALHLIGNLRISDLSWIMPAALRIGDASPIDSCLDAISQELFGSLRRLRCGSFMFWPTRETSPHFQLLTELTELELVFDQKLARAPEKENLTSVLNLFSGNEFSLKKVSLVNCGGRKNPFRKLKRDVEPHYEKVKIVVQTASTGRFDPVLAGGSVMGIRTNLENSTSFSKVYP